jgi:hypothetical protein
MENILSMLMPSSRIIVLVKCFSYYEKTVYKPCAVKKTRSCFSNTENKMVIV